MRILLVVAVLATLACAGGMVWQWQRAESLETVGAQRATFLKQVEKEAQSQTQDADKARQDAKDAQGKLKLVQSELDNAKKAEQVARADAKMQKALAEQSAKDLAAVQQSELEAKKQKALAEKRVLALEAEVKKERALAEGITKDATDAKKRLADIEGGKKKSDDLLKQTEADLRKTQAELKKTQDELKKVKEELKKAKEPGTKTDKVSRAWPGNENHRPGSLVLTHVLGGPGLPKQGRQLARSSLLLPQGAEARRGRTA